MLVTVSDYKIAVKKIKDNPNNHGFSKGEFEEIMTFEKTMQEFNDKYLSSFNKITEIISKAFSASRFSVIKFEEKLKDTRFVVNQDWFISFNLLRNLTIKQTYNAISNQDKESFKLFVLETFSVEQNNIFKSIHKIIPHRKSITLEIESLYKSNFYNTVVVLCYTQVDGICNENLNYGFFDTDRKTHELKIKELEPNDSLASKIAIQLKEPKNEISRYVKNEVNDKTYKLDSFNRHLVLHGHSIHFGTQLNAIRAILLLDFVCALINEKVIKKS